MQSPIKETDRHDVDAIEKLLAAHAEKAPPLAHDPAAAVVPQAHVAPPISIGAPIPQIDPAFPAADTGHVGEAAPSEIKIDRLAAPGAQPMSRSMKRVVMAVLALLGATTAAGWQQYGDQAKAMALEWTPPFVLAALPSATRVATAEQSTSAPATDATVSDQTATPQPVTAAAPDQPAPAVIAATPPSAEPNQLQTMSQDLAAMGRQVEELKATIAQLKASQAQLTRELAKSEEAKAVAAKPVPVEPNPRPKMSALTPPQQRPAPPPVRKPKPVTATYSSPVYTAAPAAAAPLPPVQAAAPPPPTAPSIADDGQPVVRPPMPVR